MLQTVGLWDLGLLYLRGGVLGSDLLGFEIGYCMDWIILKTSSLLVCCVGGWMSDTISIIK